MANYEEVDERTVELPVVDDEQEDPREENEERSMLARWTEWANVVDR